MALDGWADAKLADICDSIDYGYGVSASTLPVGPKFLRITDIVSGHIDWSSVPFCEIEQAERSQFKLHDGDVLIARTGASTGASAYISKPPEAVFASYLIRLRLSKKADPRFVAYFLKSPQYWAYIYGVLGDKSAQPNASAKTLTQAVMPLPPLNEQRAIADILRKLDDKIELNRRMNETLEAIARALFKSWFVDFDPVRAKAEGHQPFGMDAETAALFPDSFQDSPLGKIPRGWHAGKISKLVFLSREAVSPADFPNELFDHYSIPAFDEGRWPKEEKGEAIKSNKFIVPQDSVLLSKLNPRIPRVWFPSPRNGRRSVASTEFLVALPVSGCSREFLFDLFSSSSFLEDFVTLVTGTSGSHQRVKSEFLLEMDTAIPGKEFLDAFTRVVRPLHELVAKNLEEFQTLASLRDTLLPKLISGEIRLKALE